MKNVDVLRLILSIVSITGMVGAWAPVNVKSDARAGYNLALGMSKNLHGQNSCFLPLKQLDQDYYAPRIIQVRESFVKRLQSRVDVFWCRGKKSNYLLFLTFCLSRRLRGVTLDFPNKNSLL